MHEKPAHHSNRGNRRKSMATPIRVIGRRLVFCLRSTAFITIEISACLPLRADAFAAVFGFTFRISKKHFPHLGTRTYVLCHSFAIQAHKRVLMCLVRARGFLWLRQFFWAG